jgi:hypothetical protein
MGLSMPEFTQYPETVAQGFVLFFALLVGHMLADYPLQGDFLAVHKNRHVSQPGSKEYPDHLWIHCLLSHSMIHAGFVWIISGQLILGIAEMVLHFVLDFIKCERWTSYTTDQVLHFACKAAYVAVLMMGWVGAVK